MKHRYLNEQVFEPTVNVTEEYAVILRNCGLTEFPKRIENKECIVIGASSILDRFVELCPAVVGKIDFIADNFKCGQSYSLCGKQFEVHSVDSLRSMDMQSKVVLICSNYRYAELVEQMEEFASLKNTECYISIYIKNVIEKHDEEDVIKSLEVDKKGEPQIPKIIHCFWFSKEPKPQLQQSCLDSWKKFCPDYRIMEWNTDNYDVHKNLYMKQAVEKKKWAFASDYARLDVLHQYGGIYLDLDVEIVKNFDDLLYQKAFFAFSCINQIDLGAGMGSVKEHPLLAQLLKVYDDMEFLDDEGNMNMTPQPEVLLPMFEEYGVKMDGHMQRIRDTVFYPSDYFSPVDLFCFDIQQTENTFSIHHFAASWYDKEHIENKNTRAALAQKFLRIMKKNG